MDGSISRPAGGSRPSPGWASCSLSWRSTWWVTGCAMCWTRGSRTDAPNGYPCRVDRSAALVGPYGKQPPHRISRVTEVRYDMDDSQRPLVAITLGDPAGVG